MECPTLPHGRRAGNHPQPAVAARPSAGPPFLPVPPLFFPPSSPTFGHFGQLLLIGSSTCPPWPDPAQKLQTPITFEL
jgi:hypothetical protein